MSTTNTSGIKKDVLCLGTYMKSLKPLFTKIRDRNTNRSDFVKYSNR